MTNEDYFTLIEKKVRSQMNFRKFKVRCKAIVKAKEDVCSFNPIIARVLIECDAEGYDDWQCDGGFYHNEGELDIDWSTAKPVYPDEYEVIMGSKDYTGRHSIIEIVEVFTDTVSIDYDTIEEVDD